MMGDDHVHVQLLCQDWIIKTSRRWNIFVNNTVSGRNICRNYMNIVEYRSSFDLYLTLLVFVYKSTKESHRVSKYYHQKFFFFSLN